MADRYDAYIDGFRLDVETVRDSIEKAIAVYEYPFADGADTEDMGERARKITLRCYFLGEEYEKHKEFLDHLKKKDIFELTHPKYGLIKGRVESVAVNHDDRLETAELEIGFIEDLQGITQTKQYADVRGSVEESFVTGQTDLVNNYAADVELALGAEAFTILNTELDPELGIVEQFPNVSRNARKYLKSAEGWTGALGSDLAGVANPANSIVSIVSYPNTLAGRVIGTLARTVERYALARDTLKASPARYIDILNLGLAGLVGTAAGTRQDFARPARVATAQRLALEAGTAYGKDEANRQTLRRAESTKSFDALGNYLAPEQAPQVMTVGELEGSLSTVRGNIQGAIDETRAVDTAKNGPVITGLKTMAEQLLAHVNEIKLERDRLKRVTLDNPMPLHLVCLQNGLSYRYAERLQAVNSIKHPNFTKGEVLVYGR